MPEALPETMEALEGVPAWIECSVGGVAERAMDVTAQLTGLFVRFLWEAWLVGQAASRTFLTWFAERAPDGEDPVGQLVAGAIGILDYRELHPEDYSRSEIEVERRSGTATSPT